MIDLRLGDCLEVLKTLEDNSVDSIVTDPPYGISFMNKKWDYDVPSVEIWKECLRVLKPGGHLLSFGGSRTYHRLACAIEDSGFEIREQIMWIYGSGLSKSHNIGKALDKMGIDNDLHNMGTALKPAHEPICMARKPISEKTIAENVLKHGTGGINIDDCRIGNELRTIPIHSDDVKDDTTMFGLHKTIQHERIETTQGRFPANIMFDEEVGKLLDEQSGISKTRPNLNYKHNKTISNGKVFQSRGTYTSREDMGGASRFFYSPKASKKERGDDNIHPCVKPIKLMEYLITLVTPKGGTVLEPFMGSGSTGIAAKNLGMSFLGIEREEEYFNIAKQRIKGNE